jgi:hypothetical protein
VRSSLQGPLLHAVAKLLPKTFHTTSHASSILDLLPDYRSWSQFQPTLFGTHGHDVRSYREIKQIYIDIGPRAGHTTF